MDTNPNVKYSSVLFPPTWIFPKKVHLPQEIGYDVDRGINRLAVFGAALFHRDNLFDISNTNKMLPRSAKEEKVLEAGEKLSIYSIEINLRQMISNCAHRIFTPVIYKKYIQLKNLMPPSIRKKIIFIDKRDTIWHAVIKYLQPIYECLPTDSSNADFLSWYLYCLILATKKGAELPFNSEHFEDVTYCIREQNNLSREANARLCNIEGVFKMFSISDSISSFKILPRIDRFSISERIEEIISDAYLLEASYLRRFLSISSNKAAIKRDLTKIIRFILGNRKWAKKILTEIPQNLLLSSSNIGLLERLTEILPEISKSNPSVLLPSLEMACYDKNVSVHIAIRGRNNWQSLLVFPNPDYKGGQ